MFCVVYDIGTIPYILLKWALPLLVSNCTRRYTFSFPRIMLQNTHISLFIPQVWLYCIMHLQKHKIRFCSPVDPNFECWIRSTGNVHPTRCCARQNTHDFFTADPYWGHERCYSKSDFPLRILRWREQSAGHKGLSCTRFTRITT
jgi:hypothetical protein